MERVVVEKFVRRLYKLECKYFGKKLAKQKHYAKLTTKLEIVFFSKACFFFFLRENDFLKNCKLK